MPPSSLVWSVGTVVLSSLVPCITAQTYSYTLQDNYAGTSFYDNFNFMTFSDPTHGFVEYVNESVASTNGLIGFGTNTAKWGVDTTNVLSNTSIGRQSVRLEGKTSYNHGLFLADIKHMPGNACGVWPAFWTLGDATWPAHGEVDLIEGVNMQSGNQYAAHTADNCTMSFAGQTGPTYATDCALSTGGVTGCSVGSSGNNDYGTSFNSNGGGVYAMQWTSSFIKVWFFPRNAIPASITAGAPDYTKFGTPQANFDGGSCNIDTHFMNHHIVFDTTFCGDWAGSVYSTSTCPQAGSGVNGCVNYVANNPSAFTESYWEVNSLKIYSESVVSASSSSSASSTSSVSASSTSSTTTSLVLSSSTSTSIISSSSSPTSTTTSQSTVTVGPPMSTSRPITSASSSTTTFIPISSSTAAVTTSKSSSTTLSTTASPTSSSALAATTSRSSSTTLVTSSSTSSKALSSSTTLKSTTTSSTTTAAATPTTTTANCPADNGKIIVLNAKRFLIECSTDHGGGDLKTVTISTGGLAACIKSCSTTTGCVDVTFSGSACYLKSKLLVASKSTANGAKLLI